MYSAMQTGQRFGMQTLDQVLEDLVYKKKIVTKENAREYALNKDKFA
jgi:twitching motility protein PilT